MQINLSVNARRMPRQDFETIFDSDSSIVSKASELISEAKDQAEKLRVLIAEKDRRSNEEIQTMSDEQLKKFINVKMIEQSAEALVDVMQTASQIQKNFESLEPWLMSFVETAIRKIIGTFDFGDVVSRLVREGMAEMSPSQTTILRVHHDSYNDVLKARMTYPECFDGIGKITSDPSLQADQLLLEGSGGFIDVCLETQFTTLLNELQQ